MLCQRQHKTYAITRGSRAALSEQQRFYDFDSGVYTTRTKFGDANEVTSDIKVIDMIKIPTSTSSRLSGRYVRIYRGTSYTQERFDFSHVVPNHWMRRTRVVGPPPPVPQRAAGRPDGRGAFPVGLQAGHRPLQHVLRRRPAAPPAASAPPPSPPCRLHRPGAPITAELWCQEYTPNSGAYYGLGPCTGAGAITPSSFPKPTWAFDLGYLDSRNICNHPDGSYHARVPASDRSYSVERIHQRMSAYAQCMRFPVYYIVTIANRGEGSAWPCQPLRGRDDVEFVARRVPLPGRLLRKRHLML